MLYIITFLTFFERKNSKSQILKKHEIYKKDLTERSRIDFDTRKSAFESSDTELDFATLMQAKVDRAYPFRSTEPTNRSKSMILW